MKLFGRKEKREPKVKVKATFVCGSCKHEWEQECPEEALTDTGYQEECPVCKCYAGRPRKD